MSSKRSEAERRRLCALVEQHGFDPADVPRDGLSEAVFGMLRIETYRRDEEGQLVVKGDKLVRDTHWVRKIPGS